ELGFLRCSYKQSETVWKNGFSCHGSHPAKHILEPEGIHLSVSQSTCPAASCVPGRQQRVPMVKHDNKRCESDQLLCSIEAESRADFRSDAVINRRLARFEALSDKNNSRTLHLAVVAGSGGMGFRL